MSFYYVILTALLVQNKGMGIRTLKGKSRKMGEEKYFYIGQEST